MGSILAAQLFRIGSGPAMRSTSMMGVLTADVGDAVILEDFAQSRAGAADRREEEVFGADVLVIHSQSFRLGRREQRFERRIEVDHHVLAGRRADVWYSGGPACWRSSLHSRRVRMSTARASESMSTPIRSSATRPTFRSQRRIARWASRLTDCSLTSLDMRRSAARVQLLDDVNRGSREFAG